VLERVKLFMAMERRAYEETGERTLYAVNVTDRVDRLRETARRAVEAGVNCLMLNYLTVGLDALRMLAEDPELKVPILAHLDFAGVMYASCDTGISSHLVLGKLPRLAGADIVVYPCAYGKFALLPEKHRRIALALSSPLRGIRPAFPMPGGGLYPGNVPRLLRDLGKDCVLGAGGAIHGHPLGPAAGARAMRQAIDATLAGRPLPEAANEHPELAAALAAWGISEAEGSSLYAIK
jgi:2,3-diketo-5-methylthiopentyl-1-phosphate enolase